MYQGSKNGWGTADGIVVLQQEERPEVQRVSAQKSDIRRVSGLSIDMSGGGRGAHTDIMYFGGGCCRRGDKNHCVIHDLTFEGPRRSAGRGTRRSANADTGWEQVPGCELGCVLDAILNCMLGLRAKFGVSAFRQVGVNPDGASCYVNSIRRVFFSTFTCISGEEGDRGGGNGDGGGPRNPEEVGGTAMDSPAAVVAEAGASVAASTRCPVVDLPDRRLP